MTRQDAIRKATKGVTDLGRWIVRIPVRMRLALRDYEDAKATRLAKSCEHVPTLQERQDELIRFYGRYEELVDALCDCAQYGPNARQEGEYSELRAWMQCNYPSLRRYVSAYLRFDPKDAARALDLHSSGRDAFEALFAAPTLEEFLRSDDGEMIARIERTREALSRYGEHLRQLIAQERLR